MKTTFLTILLAPFFIFLFPFSVFAQENTSELDLPGSNSQIVINEPLILPDTETVLEGTAEPGADLFVTVLNGENIIYTQSTKVRSNGQWSVPLPAFADAPTQLLVRTEVELTLTKIIETTAVGGAVATSTIILGQILLERFFRLLQVIGIFRQRVTKGFIFDIISKKPVPFALLTIENIRKTEGESSLFRETVVSTVDGFFKTITLPRGEYALHAAHSDYSFPVTTPRPWYTKPNEFYKGETITLDEQDKLEILLIPMQPLTNKSLRLSYWLNGHVFFSLLAQISKILSVPMGVISIVLLILYPSFINFLISSIYIALGLYALLRKAQKHTLSGKVTLLNDKPVSQAVIRIYQTEPHELVTATLTDEHGVFESAVDKGTYQVVVSKDGLVLQNQGLSFESVELKKSVRNLHYQMAPPPENPFKAL